MELTVQEASDQLRQQVEDLQRKLSEVRQQTQSAAVPPTSAPPSPPTVPRRVLWVDDVPENNAYEIARLRDDGVEVVGATSTDEALQILVNQRLAVRVVISDMGRKESGTYRPRAGAMLTEQLRAAGIATPIFIYSSAKGVERAREEVLAVGGNGATSSMVELFEMIRSPLDLAG
jgi:CheY-like chemotaxis protein